jgi:menaquinone-9 beta-reductase
MKKQTDIFVVGGGPAGLAAAIAARQRGFDVIVADGSRPPIDKPCGEGLMPEACSALANLGIAIPKNESYPLRGIKFAGAGFGVQADFPGGAGMGVRRTVLHRLMLERAERLGVSFLWQTPVTGLHQEGVRLGSRFVRSRWIIGADGGNSPVRKWALLKRPSVRARYAFRQHYRVSPWGDCVEVHWGHGFQIYITPVAADEVCIALASRTPQLRLQAALADVPEIARRLHGAESSSRERGAVSSTCKARQVFRGRVVLVGDAAGTIDCVTGEGLGLAFRQADLLAECLLHNDLPKYQRQVAALARRPTLMAHLLLALDWNLFVRRRVMRAFAGNPPLFRRMVSMHGESISALNLATNGLALGWGILKT